MRRPLSVCFLAAALVAGCLQRVERPDAPKSATPATATAPAVPGPAPIAPVSTEGLAAFKAEALDPKAACTLLTEADAVRFAQAPLHPSSPKPPLRETNTVGQSLCGYVLGAGARAEKLVEVTVKRPIGFVSRQAQLTEACGNEVRLKDAEHLGEACLAANGAYAVLVERYVLIARVADGSGAVSAHDSRSLVELLAPRVKDYAARPDRPRDLDEPQRQP